MPAPPACAWTDAGAPTGGLSSNLRRLRPASFFDPPGEPLWPRFLLLGGGGRPPLLSLLFGPRFLARRESALFGLRLGDLICPPPPASGFPRESSTGPIQNPQRGMSINLLGGTSWCGTVGAATVGRAGGIVFALPDSHSPPEFAHLTSSLSIGATITHTGLTPEAVPSTRA